MAATSFLRVDGASINRMTPDLPSPSMIETWYRRIGKARPFLKWAGGKQPFLQRFAQRFPRFEGQYIEPFLGSGAVFFEVMKKQARPFRSRLGDTNKQLVETFLAVRDRPEWISERLEALQAAYSNASDKSEYYYTTRDAYNAQLPRVDPAVFVFLNRTCWNGLYRVNRQGKFNVPYGAPKSERVVPSEDDLLNASAALAQSQIRATSWHNTLAFAEPGDFVYLDPPYYSDIARDDTKYGSRQFSLREHREIAIALEQLSFRGVDFLLTNSGEAEMVQLYSEYGLDVETISVPRPINSKTDERGIPVPELIVRPPGKGHLDLSGVQGILEER